MCSIFYRVILCLAFLLDFSLCLGTINAADRARVFVLTDISNEPDDEESMVRFLVYSNEYDVEGLVATTSTWLRVGTRPDLIERQINAYSSVLPNLAKHAEGFPPSEQLLAVVRSGVNGYGMDALKVADLTPGTQLLIDAIKRDDNRPLWISVWGGANTLAQALQHLQMDSPEEDLKKYIAKLRVYSISDQDDAGPWIRRNFPGLFYIVSPSTERGEDYYRATWTGISGESYYKFAPGYLMELVSNEWLRTHVMQNHGPLGELYPEHKYIMEGDTPSILGLINNGLGWIDSPANGGWGGRYALYRPLSETRPIWTENSSSRDSVGSIGSRVATNQATIYRWREHFQYDFAARMDWCVASSYEQANHNPELAVSIDGSAATISKDVIRAQVTRGTTVQLDARGSKDPDSDALIYRWWIYPELKTFGGEIHLSDSAQSECTLKLGDAGGDGEVHVILEVRDDGTPTLWSYRRIILSVQEPRVQN